MMEILTSPVVAMVVMLGGLVLFHELGHYLVGRLCGVAVEEFSIGFGWRIASFKRGQTTYQISALPLGGFVKFYGMNRNQDVPQNLQGLLYNQASVWRRAMIIAAGPLANFLLAFLIFWGMVMVGLEKQPATVGDIIEHSRAQAAGILPGDRFVKIDDEEIHGWFDFERLISRSPEKPLKVQISRNGKDIELVLTPEGVEGASLFGSKARIGRAGVALAYPSAVATVINPASPLSKSGLLTGDRFETFSIDGGEPRKVHGFHHLLSLLKRWGDDRPGKIEVTVQPIRVTLSKDEKPKEELAGPQRTITLTPSEWPKPENTTPRGYAQVLGMVDSHLTLAVVRGESKDILKPGDHLLKWGGLDIRNVYHLQELMNSNLLPEVSITVLREFRVESLQVKLHPFEYQKPEGAVTVYGLDVAMLGVSSAPDPVIEQESNPFAAAKVAVREAVGQTMMMATGLWSIVTGAVPLKALGGPIMIAKLAGDSAKAGGLAFLATMAVISINLGLVNLFPIPVLDGGQLVLLSVEAVQRRPLSERMIENFQKVGFVLVLSLVVLVLYNDLSRFWKGMVTTVLGLTQ